MEAAFDKLKSQGKNTVDGIIQWLKDANVIEDNNNELTKEELEKNFYSAENVDYESFKETLDKLRDSNKEEVDSITNQITTKATKMEEAFENMKKQGKNDVDNLISWLKQSVTIREELQPPVPRRVVEIDLSSSYSSLLGTAKDAEQKVRKLFEGADAKNVEYSKFKEAISKLAEDQKKTVEDLTKTLEEGAPRLADALQAGASAFKDALTKIIGSSSDEEDKSRKLFDGVDAKNISLDKFKEALAKIAAEKKTTAEDLIKNLGNDAANFVRGLGGVATDVTTQLQNALK